MQVWVIRLRWAVVAAIAVLGYVAPWDRLLAGRVSGVGTGPNAHLWGVLAVLVGKVAALGVSGGFEAVLGVGIACAFGAAALRTVARARGGAENMAALGVWLNVAALSLLMPVSGAVFAVVAVAVWEWIVVREWGVRPVGQGLARAALGEAYCWGVAGSFAIAGWYYNAALLVRCVVIAAGVGLVVRGVVGERASYDPTHAR